MSLNICIHDRTRFMQILLICVIAFGVFSLLHTKLCSKLTLVQRLYLLFLLYNHFAKDDDDIIAVQTGITAYPVNVRMPKPKASEESSASMPSNQYECPEQTVAEEVSPKDTESPSDDGITRKEYSEKLEDSIM